MKKIIYILILCCFILTIFGCSTNEKYILNIKKEEHINYDKQEDWEFTSGKMQSPINIKTNKVKSMTPDSGSITLNYDKDITSVKNNGHSIQVNNGGNSIINGRNFYLNQLNFHAENEHTIDGKYYPMEVHFVNTSQDGRIAVIGVFFKEGSANKGFKEVLDDVLNNKISPIVNLEDMIPQKHSYYHYLGSLTTPPLNENVEWYVMKEPVEVSSKQIKSFKKLYSHNHREIQPLNNRVVLEYNE